MENKNIVHDNDESNQNQAISCNNNDSQEDVAPPALSKKRQRGRQVGDLRKKAKKIYPWTLAGDNRKTTTSCVQLPTAVRTNPIQRPPPAATSSNKKATKQSMQRTISNQQRKLSKAKEDQDKAVAKVTGQLNKKLA